MKQSSRPHIQRAIACERRRTMVFHYLDVAINTAFIIFVALLVYVVLVGVTL